MAEFALLPRHLSGKLEKNHKKKLIQNSRSPERDSNLLNTIRKYYHVSQVSRRYISYKSIYLYVRCTLGMSWKCPTILLV